MALFDFEDARSYYEDALKKGKREGGTPAVLEEILKQDNIQTPSLVNLGTMELNIELIKGTYTSARSNSFSKSFYPLLSINTEFASKWMSVCRYHLSDGIDDPIKVYEYLNEFYVQEGNKRLSVMRYFDSVKIRANVIRIIPPHIDDPKIHLYYEFMDFYSLSKINTVYFSAPGSFSKLQRLLDKKPNEKWSENEKKEFNSIYNRFKTEYKKQKADASLTEISDALLYYINIYSYKSIQNDTNADFNKKIASILGELNLASDNTFKIQLDPEETKKSFINKIFLKGHRPIKVAFIYEKSPTTSGWTSSHDLGRIKMEKAFNGLVQSINFYNTTPDNINSNIRKALREKCEIIFVTSPKFTDITLKFAIDFPRTKFLNCALYSTFKNMRTYYARMYEVKFLMGAIAGALSENDKVGYIADYPVANTIACVNAFALGAKMGNPRCKVYLKWDNTIDDSLPTFDEADMDLICGKDTIIPGIYNPQFGLYSQKDDEIWNIAMPLWNWDVFYEKIIQSVLDDTWNSEEGDDKSKSINYWWGLSSGLVELLYTDRLPIGTIRLIELLKKAIQNNDFNPFSGTIYAQNGILLNETDEQLSPERIIRMKYLAENIIGIIPPITSFNEESQYLASAESFKENEGSAYENSSNR